ncbi:hypothetical protein EUGRSUZ_H03786 [Eucalyptus grandis]|uniref:Uncharacterized protein n=2 Tax=Eucalyptus grandis TaxID=71139 RepID=A0ACC3JUT0_EUCGR|nr:hypothetical protein EUGRSUZ_H03786 [Eucalyptus grandis]
MSIAYKIGLKISIGNSLTYYPGMPSAMGLTASFWGLDLVVRLYDIGFGSLVYEVEKVCDDSGEDPMCSSITVHLVYYGVELMAETWGLCKIVMDPRLKEYGSEDKGNLMLLRNPSASALRLC